jgi:hypothetical protein
MLSSRLKAFGAKELSWLAAFERATASWKHDPKAS